MSQFLDNVAAAYEDCREQLNGGSFAPAAAIRERALAQLDRNGVPSVRQEAWKYTDLRGLDAADFSVPLKAEQAPEALRALVDYDHAEHTFVFVDGIFEPALSSERAANDGFEFADIGTMLREQDAEAIAELEALERNEEHSFVALNLSLLHDGALVRIAPQQRAASIQIVFISSGNVDALHCPRLVIQAAEQSECDVVETHLSLTPSASLTSAFTSAVLAPGARVRHYRLQHDDSAHHIATVEAEVARDACFETFSSALGGHLTRIDINAHLNGGGAHAAMNGLFFAGAGQHIDHHTRINHNAAHTTSEENFRGIADGGGRGVFNGKIYVAEDAQKIVAEQSSKNLLLSDGSEIDTKPELEIYADDVQCAHGATVGQLNEMELFYLRSRGIDAAIARGILTQAFAGDVIQRMHSEPLREAITAKVFARVGESAAVQVVKP